MRVEFRPAARADLDAIARYTKREWGTVKARAYLGQLRAFAEGLRDFPQRFPSYNSPLGPFRKAPCGEHLVFYVIAADKVEIVRVLHNRVDVDALLG